MNSLNNCIKNIAVINGPVLNMTGIRETHYYGEKSMKDILNNLYNTQSKLYFYQSNHEGDLVDYIITCNQRMDGIIINPASFTINGYSILEALITVNIPFIEIHMSNIYARGGWHSKSIFTSTAIGMICGLKYHVYQVALDAICKYLTYDDNQYKHKGVEQ